VLNKAGVLTVGLAVSHAIRSTTSIWNHARGARGRGEEKGLSVLTRKRCATVVSIPQLGKISSLNAGVAVSVAALKWRVNEFDVRSEIQLGTSDPTTFECSMSSLAAQGKDCSRNLSSLIFNLETSPIVSSKICSSECGCGTTLVRLRAPSL